MLLNLPCHLIPSVQVAGVNLVLHVVQAAVKPVGNNHMTDAFEAVQIVDDQTAGKKRAVFQRWFNRLVAILFILVGLYYTITIIL